MTTEPAQPAATRAIAPSRKLTLLPLIAATYFMVAGGPYGLEDLIGKTGYAAALGILVLTPLLWSVPTAMMVSELASAIPDEGGFYIWVRRGMGPFWGFQESWLTLTGSVFEMALYPTLFVDYLSRFAPRITAGHRGLALELAMIATCAAWNIVGARAVGNGSIWLNALLFLPFLALVILAAARAQQPRRPRPQRHRRPISICSAAFSSPCGTTWVGTISRPSPVKSIALRKLTLWQWSAP